MNPVMGLALPARAKLNLVLRITGRRADGYHLLETLFHTVELHDDLWLAPAERGISLHVTADRPELVVAASPDNLVTKALERLLAVSGRRHGFVVHLHKRIPHGAGLGGGSSDAAAALRLGNAVCGDPLDGVQLDHLATTLGADVPFFLRGGSQWGRGIGEMLEPAIVPPRHFVLVVPPFGCATVDVYKNYAALWNSAAAQVRLADVTEPNTRDSAVRSQFRNDLLPAAERVAPALGLLRRRIAELGFADVAMTGSGSALFVACTDEAAAEACAQRLGVLAKDKVRVVVTRSAGGLDVPERLARRPGRQ